MKIQYVAADGQIFTSEEDCRKYEAKTYEDMKMYSRNGVITDNVDCAIAVKLGSDDAVRLFINSCIASGSRHEGISEGDCGIFVWDDYDERYYWLTPDACTALYGLLKDQFKDD